MSNKNTTLNRLSKELVINILGADDIRIYDSSICIEYGYKSYIYIDIDEGDIDLNNIVIRDNELVSWRWVSCKYDIDTDILSLNTDVVMDHTVTVQCNNLVNKITKVIKILSKLIDNELICIR